jgi:short-subunit dehydrogenase
MEKAGLITGASSGIGWELAKIHASKGNHVVLVARRAQKLEQLAQEIQQTYGVKTWVIEADLSKVEGVNKVIESTQRDGIFVNYLFNNAGFGGWGKFADRSAENDAQMIDVNVQALTRLMHAYLPSMLEHNEGRILNTASTAGFYTRPATSHLFCDQSICSFTDQSHLLRIKKDPHYRYGTMPWSGKN